MIETDILVTDNEVAVKNTVKNKLMNGWKVEGMTSSSSPEGVATIVVLFSKGTADR